MVCSDGVQPCRYLHVANELDRARGIVTCQYCVLTQNRQAWKQLIATVCTWLGPDLKCHAFVTISNNKVV